MRTSHDAISATSHIRLFFCASIVRFGQTCLVRSFTRSPAVCVGGGVSRESKSRTICSGFQTNSRWIEGSTYFRSLTYVIASRTEIRVSNATVVCRWRGRSTLRCAVTSYSRATTVGRRDLCASPCTSGERHRRGAKSAAPPRARAFRRRTLGTQSSTGPDHPRRR